MSSQVKTRTLEVVFAAIFASLAVLMTVTKLVFPFPILPYLNFELAEIPVIIVFLIAGPFPGLTSSVIYWLILNLVGEWVPIGPAMKFLTVVSTLAGIWAGLALNRKLLKERRSTVTSLIFSILFAIIGRVLVTSLLNFVVLWYLFPFFLDIAAGSLKLALGLQIPSPTVALLLSLLFTAVFNILHTFLSILPSYVVVKAVVRAKVAGLRELWVDKTIVSG